MTTRALTPYQAQMEKLRDTLSKAMPKIADVLPAHIPAKRLHRILLAQFTESSKLWECSPGSVIGSILESAQIGLEVAVGGQCWLIPFKRKSTLVIGYKGYKDLAYRTGYVGAFNAEAVYENDTFTYHRAFGHGDEPYIVHDLNESPLAERGHLRGAYCAVQMKSGQWVLKYLSKPEVLERRKRSRMADRPGSVWVSDERAMWIKTAVRAAAPLLPADYNFSRAHDLDTQADLGKQDLTVKPGDFNVSEAEWEDVKGEADERRERTEGDRAPSGEHQAPAGGDDPA
jgi:recombination protein RecT